MINNKKRGFKIKKEYYILPDDEVDDIMRKISIIGSRVKNPAIEQNTGSGIFSYYTNLFKGHGYEFMKEYYNISSDNFFAFNTNNDEDVKSCYLQIKNYFPSAFFINNQTKSYSIVSHLKNFKGFRLHLLHNRALVIGYYNEYKEWYLSNGYPEEQLLINYYCNTQGTKVISMCGYYWIFEKEEIDVDRIWQHGRCPSTDSMVYTMAWKSLVIKMFLKADRHSFNKFVDDRKIPTEIVLKFIKNVRIEIINRIIEKQTISIRDTYLLKALIRLGFNKYLLIVNNYEKTFKKHKQTMGMFPIRSNEYNIKERNKKINARNDIDIDKFTIGVDTMENVWSSIFAEE